MMNDSQHRGISISGLSPNPHDINLGVDCSSSNRSGIEGKGEYLVYVNDRVMMGPSLFREEK